MRARRSCLSVPGSSEAMLAKAASLPADELVVDLEDSVAPAAKEDARAQVAAALEAEGSPSARGRAGERDRQPVVRRRRARAGGRAGARIGSLVVPKVEVPQDVASMAALLDSLGEPAAEVRVQALVETARGLLAAGRSPPRPHGSTR